MAEVTQIDNLSTPMPPLNGAEAPKRKRGRPFGSTKAAAEPEYDRRGAVAARIAERRG